MSRVEPTDKALLATIEDGLPLVAEPYAEVGRQLGTSESDVIARLKRLVADGIIKRLGFVVKHREVGFTANAMVVWNIPDGQVDVVAGKLAAQPMVTLCYRRPRRLPDWPYNLFCMVHGSDRNKVLAQIDVLKAEAGIGDVEHSVLFSKRCFKQRGARFSNPLREKAS